MVSLGTDECVGQKEKEVGGSGQLSRTILIASIFSPK